MLGAATDFVNGSRVAFEIRLTSGDLIEAGGVSLRFFKLRPTTSDAIRGSLLKADTDDAEVSLADICFVGTAMIPRFINIKTACPETP